MAATAITSLTLTATNTTSETLSDNNAANSALDAYYVFVKALKVAYDASESGVTEVASSVGTGGDQYFDQLTSGTDATYTITLVGDGWYKFKYVAVPEWDVATAFSDNDVSASPITGLFYQANKNVTGGTDPSVNTTDWDVLADPSTVIDDVGGASDPGNIYYQEFDTIVTENTKQAQATQAALAAVECCTDCKRREDVELYELLSIMVKSMDISEDRGNYAQGEKIARRAAQLI